MKQKRIGRYREQGLMVLLLWRFFLAMLIYTLCRLVFVVYNADLLQFSGLKAVCTALWGGLQFDLSALLYVNALLILLHLFPFPYKYTKPYQGVLNVVYWLCNIPALILNLGDVVYYRFTGKRTSFAVLDEFGNENPLNFLHFFVRYWEVTLWGVILIAVWVYLYYRFRAYNRTRLRPWAHYTLYGLFTLLAVPLTIGGIRGGFARGTRPMGPIRANLYIERPQQRAAVLNTPFVMIRLVGKQSLPEYRFMSEVKCKQHFSALRVSADSTEYTAKYKGKNVVFIIWESLAKEWVGMLNKDIPNYRGFTPFLDSLMQRSYYFTRAYAGAGESIDALPAILASVPRPISSFISSSYSGNKLYGLPHILTERGYDTRFYHNAANASMGFNAMSKQLGFATHHGMTEFNNDAEYDGAWGIWDEPFLQYVAQDINTLKEPFLAVEFTTSSHEPYAIPKRYEGRFHVGAHPQHRSMQYTDYALEQFFRTASKQPWYKNTLFIITADHAVPGHLEKYKNSNGLHAIPIIFFDPQIEWQGVESQRVVQQADFLPTLLDLLGIEARHVAFGHNMFAEGEDHFAVSTMGEVFQMIRGDYALHFDGERVLALYDVKRDPELKRDLKNSSPEVLKEMLPTLQAYMQELSHRMRHNQLKP